MTAGLSGLILNGMKRIAAHSELSRPAVHRGRLAQILYAQRYLILMTLPAAVLVFIFRYVPIYGITISFKQFNIGQGILGSPWVGFKWFELFFENPFSWRLIRNTFALGFWSLIIGFPAPILLALLLNELRSQKFKRAVQTLSYLPYFISTVIIVGILRELAAENGLFNSIVQIFQDEPIRFFNEPAWFRPLYIGSDIWQNLGWGTIIYLAALSGVDPQLYESAIIDGAGRFKQAVHITLPSIAPTIIVLLILRVGAFFAQDFQKVLLMYNPLTYETGDIIATFIFREGIENARFSYSAAVGLMLSVVAFLFLYVTNWLSRRFSETSLW